MTKLAGDHDFFGDGNVTIIATPGHTSDDKAQRDGQRMSPEFYE